MPREFKPIYRTEINDIYIRVDKVTGKCIVPNCKETDCYDIQLEKPDGCSFLGGTLCQRHFEDILNNLHIVEKYLEESEEVGKPYGSDFLNKTLVTTSPYFITQEEAIAELKAIPINYPLTNAEDRVSRLMLARDMAIRALEYKPYDFARWVATEIFDENWEYNKEAFAELACRKLAKLGIVIRMSDEWELIESLERSDKE